MIQRASKYTNVREAATAPPSGRAQILTPGQRAGAAAVYVPTARGSKDIIEWFWREMKDGGWLRRYLAREKHHTPAAIRQVARLMAGFQQNNKSEFRRVAAIPKKLFHRWKNEDEHFFDDDSNLRSLKRDNPDLPVYLPPAPLPRQRFHKVYSPAPCAA